MELKLNKLKCLKENIDIEEYLLFRELVQEQMENPLWAGEFNEKDLENMLEMDTRIWMYYYKDEPICSMMLIPLKEKKIKSLGLELKENDVYFYGPMIVNPKYQRKGLQMQMLKELDKYCITRGIKNALVMVNPYNNAVIKNLLKDNFKLVNQRITPKTVMNIYIKKLI